MDFIYKGMVRKYTLMGSEKLGSTKSRITLEIQKNNNPVSRNKKIISGNGRE